jgi:effector-binding domain-containing protein
MMQNAQGKPGIRLVGLREQHVASARATCQRPRLRRTIAILHEMVMDEVGLQGLAPAGPLFARFHHAGSVIEVEAGIPLVQPIRAHGHVTPSTLPGGPALSTVSAGRPADVYNSVRALRSFCNSAGLLATGGYWECYLAHAPVGADGCPLGGEGCECEIALYLPVSRVRTDGRGAPTEAAGREERSGGHARVELAAEPDRPDPGRPSVSVPRSLHGRPPDDEQGVPRVRVVVALPGSEFGAGMNAIGRLLGRSATRS